MYLHCTFVMHFALLHGHCNNRNVVFLSAYRLRPEPVQSKVSISKCNQHLYKAHSMLFYSNLAISNRFFFFFSWCTFQEITATVGELQNNGKIFLADCDFITMVVECLRFSSGGNSLSALYPLSFVDSKHDIDAFCVDDHVVVRN